jgi:[acyl-carrier-protein] S-malonyltransferase
MKIGMLFPGYPSQYVGMGKELYDNSRIVQEYFEEASNCLGMNFVKLCFASSDAEITKVSNAYPALFLSGISIAHMVQEVFPDMLISGVAGYGVGEYSALYTANAITAPDGLYLLNKFAHFYQEYEESLDLKTVAVTGLSERVFKQLLDEHPDVFAISYDAERYVVSGPVEALDAWAEVAKGVGALKGKKAQAIDGYHTSLLQPVVEQLTPYLTKVDFNTPEFTVVSCLDGKPITKALKAQEVIMRQIVKPVQWRATLKQFADYDMLLVPGPSKLLVKELLSVYPDKIIMGIETMADMRLLQSVLYGEAVESLVEIA